MGVLYKSKLDLYEVKVDVIAVMNIFCHQKKLDAAVLYRTDVRERLELDVVNLNQLNSTLQLLEELVDMENKIDDIYLPIETMYSKLRYTDSICTPN